MGACPPHSYCYTHILLHSYSIPDQHFNSNHCTHRMHIPAQLGIYSLDGNQQQERNAYPSKNKTYFVFAQIVLSVYSILGKLKLLQLKGRPAVQGKKHSCYEQMQLILFFSSECGGFPVKLCHLNYSSL